MVPQGENKKKNLRLFGKVGLCVTETKKLFQLQRFQAARVSGINEALSL
jgi:hypothetical protein